jgi:hypothetical protein
LVAVGDVLAADPSLAVSVELDISTGIERRATYKDWDSFTVEE